MAERGRFVVFEGIDGSGKTTQAEMLVDYINSRGNKALMTREHTRDGVVGGMIDLVLNKRVALDGVSLQIMFVADRIDHTTRFIKPTLESGTSVVCDRYSWSTAAYANLTGDVENFWEIQKRLVMEPDLFFLVDIEPELAMERLNRDRTDLTIFEKKEKLATIREGYRWLVENSGSPCLVVDGSGTVEEVHRAIIAGWINLPKKR